LQKKLRQRITAQWKREKLTRDELQQRRIAEDADICEPEQGSILGEDSDDDKDMMLNKEQLRDLMFETSKEVVRPYDFKTNDLCMFAGYSNIEDDRQSFKPVTQTERRMTIYGHTGGPEGSQGRMKGNVKANNIERTGQEELDKVVDETLEEISKIERLIQGSNEDQCYEWPLRKQKVKWYALQQRQRQKRKELKEAELKQRLMMTKGVHSCEYESKSFLGEKDKTNKRLIENLIDCLNTESQEKVLVIESSNKTLESCGFKTNFLYVNADCNEEERQSFNVVTEKEGSKKISLPRIEEE